MCHIRQSSPVSRPLVPYSVMDRAAWHGVSFLPSVTQGRDCDINAFLTQGCGCVINASRRCGVLQPVVAAPVRPGCRDLLHSALVSGRLCQVRAARHCSFPNSVLELLTGDPPFLGSKKQRVVKVPTDAWLATGGQGLEASTRTSPPATLSSPLPPLVPWVQKFLMDWAAEGRKSLLRRDLRRSIVSSMVLPPFCYPLPSGITSLYTVTRSGCTSLQLLDVGRETTVAVSTLADPTVKGPK